MRSMSRFTSLLAAVALLAAVMGATQAQTTYVWNSTLGGDWDTGGNWTPTGPADGAGNTADFGQQDISGYADVAMVTNRTLGHLVIGDTDPVGSPGVWTLYGDDGAGTYADVTVTLDNNGSTPSITVNTLGEPDPGINDAFLDHILLAGTAGFAKEGDGILTIGPSITGNSLAGLSGTIDLNGGTLRLSGGSALSGGPTLSTITAITAADGTTLDLADLDHSTWVSLHDYTADAGATVTIRTGYASTLTRVQSAGSGTLNLIVNGTKNFQPAGSWGAGWDVINMTSDGSNATMRAKRDWDGWWATMDGNLQLNLTGISWSPYDMWSSGVTAEIGALNGDAASVWNGTSGGGQIRAQIGGRNEDCEFAGTVGAGNHSIEKVGTATLTFSGNFTGFGGHALRVTSGTVALTGTATSIQGGVDALHPTSINVVSGGTLDVSGTDTTFTSVANQKFIGVGPIVGPFDHAAGDIDPADTDPGGANPGTGNTPVAGTIAFSGALSFTGGNINYDMDNVPTGSNDLITVSGTTSVSGGGTVTPNFMNGDPAVGLTYTFLTSSGGFSDAVSGWTVNWPGRGTKPSVFINGNDLQFTTTAIGAGGSVVWTGANSGTWDVESATEDNWALGGSPDDFFQGDEVTFPEAGVTNFAVDIAEAVQPASMVVDSTTDYTFTNSGGAITSSGSFTKRGSSTVTMQFANTFANATIEAGTVDIGGGTGALGTGILTLGDGTSGGATLIANAALGSSEVSVNAGTNAIQVGGSAGSGSQLYLPTLSSASPGSLTISSDVNDRWIGLNQTGGYSGFLTLDGPDTGAGEAMTVRVNGFNTDLSGAYVSLIEGVRIGSQSGSSGINVVELGALEGDATAKIHAFIGGGGAPGVEYAIGHLNVSTEFAGIIEDGDNSTPGYITKLGSGTLTLSGANTYTGDTSIEAGTLSITSDFLADAADVYLTTGAIFDLDFAATDVIDSLYFDGISQAIGTYGAIGSGATYESAFFSGTGLLSVSTYVASDNADFDGDGDVDLADLMIWQRGYSVGTTQPEGDANSDGTVDATDLGIWQNQLGTAQAAVDGAVMGVPEPGAIMLATLGLLAVTAARRRRQS